MKWREFTENYTKFQFIPSLLFFHVIYEITLYNLQYAGVFGTTIFIIPVQLSIEK